MKQELTLVVLAGGLGSRFGSLKQLSSVTDKGDTMISLSVEDAIEADFTKVVFIIRKSFEEEFIEKVAKQFIGRIAIEYVYQECDSLPEKYLPTTRVKPWGTAHALYVALPKITSSFAIINADDYYGRSCYQLLAKHLKESTNNCLISYELAKTLSNSGTVTRGVCTVENSCLTNITETFNLKRVDNIITNGEKTYQDNTKVSMNCWGFHLSFLEYLPTLLDEFLSENINSDTKEFYLPGVVDDLIKQKKIKVEVISCLEQWLGITYKEDTDYVIEQFKKILDYYDDL